MKTLVCLLEEPSAKEMLKGILSRMLPEQVLVKYIVFEGKSDLKKHLSKRMQGWRKPDSVFLVMQDQDLDECKTIKTDLEDRVAKTGKQESTLIRIACRELESFYMGDLAAVGKALNIKNLDKSQTKRKYQTPDQIHKPAEELARLTKKKYQKISGSRAIGPELDLTGRNLSSSFNALLIGIQKLQQKLAE